MPEQMTTTATTTTTTTTTTTSAHQAQPLSFGDVLEELEIRFLANLPDEDLASAERLYQHIEQAHWFYEDFYADNHEHLPHLGLGAFAKRVMEQSQMLRHLQPRAKELTAKVEMLYQSWFCARRQLEAEQGVLAESAFQLRIREQRSSGRSAGARSPLFSFLSNFLIAASAGIEPETSVFWW